MRRGNRFAKTQSQLLDGMRTAFMFYEASHFPLSALSTSSQLPSYVLGLVIFCLHGKPVVFSSGVYCRAVGAMEGYYYCCFLVLQYFFFIFYIYMQGRDDETGRWTCGGSPGGELRMGVGLSDVTRRDPITLKGRFVIRRWAMM